MVFVPFYNHQMSSMKMTYKPRTGSLLPCTWRVRGGGFLVTLYVESAGGGVLCYPVILLTISSSCYIATCMFPQCYLIDTNQLIHFYYIHVYCYVTWNKMAMLPYIVSVIHSLPIIAGMLPYYVEMKLWCFRPLLCTLFRPKLGQADAGDNEAKLMT